MRRSAITSAILACLLSVLWSAPASAHPGATVFTIQVKAPTSISILVPADYGKPITEVDVTDAPGFDLIAGEPPPGWKVVRTGDTLVFSGGVITIADEFAVFAIRGTATTKGELLFPITTRDPDGSSMTYDGQPGTKNQGAIVYAGVVPKLPGAHGFPTQVAGGVVAGIGVVGTALILLRRRRSAARAPVEAVPPDA